VRVVLAGCGGHPPQPLDPSDYGSWSWIIGVAAAGHRTPVIILDAMSTAATVPVTEELDLEHDDALETLRSVGFGELLHRSFLRFRYADGFSHSRALAFQFILTLLPALIAVVGFARVLGQDTFTSVLTGTVEDIAPGPAGQVLTQAFEQGSGSGRPGVLALAFGLFAAVVAAAGAMGQIERGSNRIYGVERDRPSLRKYLVATALALTAGAAAVSAFVLVVFGSEIGDALGSARDWTAVAETAWSVGRWPVGATLVAVAVALLFTVSPNRHQPQASWLALGSILAVFLWFVFTGLLAVYIGASGNFGETYGPLAGFLGLMLWALLTALALFLGLAVAAQLEAERAGEPGPARSEVPPGTSATGSELKGDPR
jgi:YihY family inner membrane protein